jgi:outer membrane receptor protein involved in Fe transport
MKRRGCAVGLAGAAVLWATAARAQEDRDLSSLLDEPVVTTASSTAETGTTAPATSSIVTAEDLKRYGMHTLGEAVSYLALGVASQHKLDDEELGARGVELVNDTGNHFLLLLDGHKVNDPYQSFDLWGRFSGIPLEIVDHIEVVLGPGSVLYGSNAMLGVINVVTKRGRDAAGVRVGADADVATNVRPWVGYGAKFDLLGTAAELSVTGQYFHAVGPKFYFPPQVAGLSSTGSETTLGCGVANDSSKADAGGGVLRLSVGAFDMTLRGQVSDSPIWGAPSDFDSPQSHRVDRTLWVGVKHSATFSPVVHLDSRIYAAHADHDIVFTVTNNASVCPLAGVTCKLDDRSQAQWAGAEVKPIFDWYRDGRFVTMLGIDVTARSALSRANPYDDATGQLAESSEGLVNRHDVIAGAYAQQTWNPERWIGFNGGARLDYDVRFNPVLSPRIAANVEAWKGGSFKAIYSEAFRAPSLFESYFTNPLLPPPNPPLRPEKTRSVEGSFEQKFAGQRLFFGGFYTRLTDIIQLYHFDTLSAAQYFEMGLSPLPPLYQERNVETIDSTGLNAGFEGSLDRRRLSYGATVTDAYARATATTSAGAQPLDVAPHAFGNVHASYALPGDLPTLAVAARWMSARFDENYSIYPKRPTVPASLELRATALGVVPGVKGLSYRVSASYLSVDRNPFLVGPSIDSVPHLQPLDTFRVTVGLTYEVMP